MAEVVPVTATLVMLGLLGEFPASAALVAAALCGAMLGFAPFNRPIARVFLGDVGSLPIGLLLGWCLLQLAFRQQFAAALLLPLYYLLDATVTLLRRLAKGASRSGRPIARISISGQPTMALQYGAWSARCLRSTSCWRCSRSDRSWPPRPRSRVVLLLTGSAATALVMYRFSRHRAL